MVKQKRSFFAPLLQAQENWDANLPGTFRRARWLLYLAMGVALYSGELLHIAIVFAAFAAVPFLLWYVARRKRRRETPIVAQTVHGRQPQVPTRIDRRSSGIQ